MGSSTFADNLKKGAVFVHTTASEEETVELAKTVAACLRAGDWISLVGELGAGKTVFVRGIAEALHCRGSVRSATFVLVQTYPAKSGRHLSLNHVDLYRLSPQEMHTISWEDLLDHPGVTVLEWAEKATELWPPSCLPIRMTHEGPESRSFHFLAAGDRADELTRRIRDKLKHASTRKS